MTNNLSIDWPNIVRALRNGDCILLLGPEAATLRRAGQTVSLKTLLIEHLIAKIYEFDPAAKLVAQPSLAYVSKTLEDIIFVKTAAHDPNFAQENARKTFNEFIVRFYEQYTSGNFAAYDKLAKLPFQFIIDTSPAPYLTQALEDENKFYARCEYFHYANPTHNNAIRIGENDIRPDAPLVYQLFGAAADPDSMIFTERDQLAFIDAVLQQEKTAGIPDSVAIHFTSGKKKDDKLRFEKTFIFLGFDFNEWHLRLIMYLIARYKRQKETYVLQKETDLLELTAFFYRNNYSVRFEDQPAANFLENLWNEYQKPPAKGTDTTGKLKVLLMYAPEDEAIMRSLESHLQPLKRTELIETWDESQMLPGDERAAELMKQITAADVILMLISADFFGSDDIYGWQLTAALERDAKRETVVIPILMRSCSWEGTALDKLPTILPRNRIALDKQEQPDVALADTVDQIKGLCQKVFKRKNTLR